MTTTLQSLSDIRGDNPTKKIVLALGSFDIIHPAHIAYLEWAKQQGDILVVTLKSDEQIQLHKGPTRPVVTGADRVRVVSALKPVDYALIGAEGGLFEAAIATAHRLQPDIVVLGPDWGPRVLSAWQKEFPNMNILVAPASSDHSSSAIIKKITDTIS